METSVNTNSREETIILGQTIARFLFPSSVVTLSGDLGAGKTTLVSGIANGLGITEKVTSPTFNILKCYFHEPLSLFHIDAYRLESGNKDIGLEEFIEGNGSTVIEWPVFIKEMIPERHLDVEIHNLGDDRRSFSFSTDDERFFPLLRELEGR